MKRPRVRVSDHAVVRYLERVGGFDIERLRAEIARRVEAGVKAGACGVTIDGYSYRIRVDEHGPVVSTILDANMGTSDRRRREGREE